MVFLCKRVGGSVDTRLREELAACCANVRWDVDMGAHSTFKTGGRVEALADVGEISELRRVLRLLDRRAIAWRMLGGGSNFLLASPIFHGVFIRLKGVFRTLPFVREEGGAGGEELVVGCGCSLSRLVNWCIDHGLGGLEGLAGIPGTVGGAVRMNAGAFDCEISQLMSALTVITADGAERNIAAGACRFSYRTMQLPDKATDKGVIISVTLKLEPGRREVIQARCRENVAIRKSRQPLAVGSAGSFFKNPPGDTAGRLIDAAGLKGLTRGGAMVSPGHGNFLINTGKATPEDILTLMKEVQEGVYQKSGIRLEPEVVIL